MRKVISVLVVVLVLLLSVNSSVYARPNTNNPSASHIIVNHVVRAGETIYCIARAYKVSPAAIIRTNWVPNPNRIHPGQVLAIPNVPATLPPGPTCVRQDPPPPPPPPVCTCVQYHTVVTGDTLSRIARLYNVNMWRIAECNKIYNLNYIRIGDVLCIPDK